MCNRGNFLKLQECVYKEAGLLNQDIECDWLDWMFGKCTNVFIYVFPYKKKTLQAGLCGDNLRPPIGPGATCDTTLCFVV